MILSINYHFPRHTHEIILLQKIGDIGRLNSTDAEALLAPFSGLGAPECHPRHQRLPSLILLDAHGAFSQPKQEGSYFPQSVLSFALF